MDSLQEGWNRGPGEKMNGEGGRVKFLSVVFNLWRFFHMCLCDGV